MQKNKQSPDDGSDRRTFQRIGLAGVCLASLVAVLGLLGWVTGWQLLTSVRSDLIPMAPSTSLAFLLFSGITLALITDSLRGRSGLWLTVLVILLVMIFGLLAALTQFAGLNFNLEDALMPAAGFFSPGVPLGHMSSVTGVLFIMTGAALLALLFPPARSNPSHIARNLAGVLASLVSAAGLTFLIAYLLGQPLLYNFNGLIPISAPASLGFMCLGIGIEVAAGLGAFPGEWFSGTSTRARILRAMAPVIILIGLFNFIADPLSHFLSGGNLVLSTAIMSVAYMLAAGIIFGLAARGLGRSMDQTEADRIQAADELRALFAAMSDIVLIYDAEGRYLQIAPTNPTLLFRPSDEMVGKTVDQVLPAQEASMVHAAIRQALAENRTVHTSYSLLINGAEVWFDGAISPLSVNTVFFVARDVTASRQADQALRESEARFRSITEQLSDLVALTDDEGRIRYASPASQGLFGVTPEEMTGRHFMDFLDETSVPAARAAFEQDLRTNSGSVRLELLMKRRDGSTFIGELNASLIPTGSLVTIRDISERKRAEEVLNRMAAVVESSDDAIISKSLEGVILNWNASAERLYGYSAAEVIGQPISILLPPGQLDDIEQILAKVSTGEHLSHYETLRRAKDGRLVDVSLSISPIRDTNGNVVAASTIARDITQRKRAEEQIRQLNRDLEKRVDERTASLQLANLELARAARMKDEFLASMSHELRTPLTGILGLSESLQMNTYGELSEKQMRILKLIEDSGRHLLDLINDILDLSKIEAGRFELQIERTGLTGICQASLQMTRSMAQKKHLQTSFSMTPPEIVMQVDVRRLKQMLVNLLSNAVKFTPEGGSLGLDVTASPQENVVRFTVWDTGIGISPENLPRLFQVFVQLDSKLSRQYAGTGLGLALVKRLAELHGGGVQVESTPGQGSRFSISLPLRPLAAQPQGNSTETPRPVSLCFDEEDIHAELLDHYLNNLGYESHIQPVALGAVEVTAGFHPAIVLAHFNLPDKPGFQLLNELKADARTQDIPVLIMAEEDLRVEALAQGAAGFLCIPFNQADLLTELEQVNSRVAAHRIAAARAHPQVLIADDDWVVLEVVLDYLSLLGYRVKTVQSGEEMLASVEQFIPDILLVDIQMPGLSGLEVMRRIRAHSNPLIARLPMIAVTALAMSGDRERILAAGANEYISKPVRLEELDSTIQRLCS